MQAIRERLIWVLRILEKIAERSCEVAIIMMTGLVLLQVFLRYVLRAPLPWVEEATVFLMIWMTFIGGGVAIRRGSHIAMSMLVERFPVRISHYLLFASQVAILFFLLVLTWQGWLLTMSVEGQRSPALEIPMSWPYLTMPIGGCFMVSQLIATMLERGPDRTSYSDAIT